jgi:TonB family protein
MEQPGTVLMSSGNAPGNSFPKECRRGFLSRIEPHFALVFGILLAISFALVIILSYTVKISNVVSQKEILQIQERYAQLVMNQPEPKKAPVVKETKTVTEEKTTEKAEQAKTEEVKVDREKESFADKEKRKEATEEDRRQKREMIAQQVQSSGIFAAITSSSGSSSGPGMSASDLLGSSEGDQMMDLSTGNVSKGTFATRNVDKAELESKKGTRTTDVGIKTEEVKSTKVTQLASSGSVSISSQPPQITGESASSADRSQTAISQVVNRETQRLKRVYEEWLKRDPALNGRLTVKFVILPSGSVSSVSVVKSTTENAEFDETILRYIRRWQFPPVDGGSPVEVVYPFVFEGLS